MFSPRELGLERGWPGKIVGDRVVQLAAQTLQAFFTGGGGAREHAEHLVAEVILRAPVLHPPSVRIFDDSERFEFANPAAIVGSAETIGGFTLMAEIRAPQLTPPKDRDFALVLGPVVVTPDEAPSQDFDWEEAVALAARNTRLLPGDLLAAPAHELLPVQSTVAVELDWIGTLRATVHD